MLIMPIKSVQILIATTIDTNKDIVFLTDYYKPYKVNASYKVLAKTMNGFKEISCKVGIIQDYAYDVKLNNNYVLRIFKNSLVYAYNRNKFIPVEELANNELLCDITYKANASSSYIQKVDTNDIEVVNATFIKFAKEGQYPFLTKNYIRNKQQAYNGKKVTITEVSNVGIVTEKVVIIERDEPIVNVIYYM